MFLPTRHDKHAQLSLCSFATLLGPSPNPENWRIITSCPSSSSCLLYFVVPAQVQQLPQASLYPQPAHQPWQHPASTLAMQPSLFPTCPLQRSTCQPLQPCPSCTLALCQTLDRRFLTREAQLVVWVLKEWWRRLFVRKVLKRWSRRRGCGILLLCASGRIIS